MKSYIIGRLIQSILCLFAVLAIVFFVVRLSGDPTYLMLGMEATQQDYDQIREHLGLDKPVITQFVIFIKNITKGDFGRSIYYNIPVVDILKIYLPPSLELGLFAIVWSVIIGLPLGVYSAVKRGSTTDSIARIIAVFGQCAPPFWFGLMLSLVFGVWLGILPVSGRDGFLSIVLPGITLGVWLLAVIVRVTRSSMLSIIDSEYIKMARLKGLSELVVIWKHAFINALLPIITYASITFVAVLAGAVTTETVFSWPGIGRLIVQAVIWRDFPVVQGVVVVIAFMYITTNFFVDIIYSYLNPKIKRG